MGRRTTTTVSSLEVQQRFHCAEFSCKRDRKSLILVPEWADWAAERRRNFAGDACKGLDLLASHTCWTTVFTTLAVAQPFLLDDHLHTHVITFVDRAAWAPKTFCNGLYMSMPVPEGFDYSAQTCNSF